MTDQDLKGGESASQDTGYVFDHDEALLLVPLVDAAFSSGAGYIDAHVHLGAAMKQLRGDVGDSEDPASTSGGEVEEPTEPQVHPTVAEPVTHEIDRAMMYELLVPFEGQVTCSLGRHEGAAWPPAIQDVTSDVADLWEFLAEHVAAAGGKARFHDLAFTHGRDRLAHAAAARDAYLEFGRSRPVVDLDEGHALLRAWAIDRQLGRKQQEQETREAMHQALVAAWDAGERAAGVLLPLLGALCRTSVPAEEDVVPVDPLLLRAGALYATDDSVKYIGELRRSRASSNEERRAVAEWQVDQLAKIARQSEGLVKVMRLQDAIDEARRLHLSEMRDALTVELQALPASDVELQSVSSTVAMSWIPFERFFRRFTTDHDWRVGMGGFAHMPPPTGSVDELKAKVEERRKRPRLVDMFRPVLLDEDRLPSWTPQSDEEHDDHLMAREAMFAADFNGLNLSQILDRIHQRYGEIPASELTAFLAQEGRGNYELAAVAVRALNHYWSGDLEACVHIAVPRIESAARLILKQLDVAIYRTQLGRRPGLYPQLGTLLDALENLDFDEDWIYYLRWLLVDHSGKNLRNQIAHGRVRGNSPVDAALVLRALMLLVLLAGPGNADDLGQDGDQVTRPVAPPQDADDELSAKIQEPAGTPTVDYPSTRWLLVGRLATIVRDRLRRMLRPGRQ